MSLLAQLSTDDSIENETDNLGGSKVLDSGIYKATVQYAYIGKADSGALSLVCKFVTEDNKEFRQTFWMTSGSNKGCKNYYETKDGQKKYLPGFVMANSLALLTAGKEISTLDTETKVIKLWNKDLKAETPTKVDMLMDLVNQEIIVGLLRQTVDKTVKANDGTYVPTGETRDENEVDKFFRARDGKTTTEIRNQAEEATFLDLWKTKHTGVTKDKSKGASSGAVAGAPKAAAAAKKPAVNLFD
jgi:hypothetical protein